MTKRLFKAWQIFLDILFPPLCLNCRKLISSDGGKENLLCDSCFKGILVYKTVFLAGAGFPLMATASYDNDALKDLIHYFKYEGFLAAERPLAKIIEKYFSAFPSSNILPSNALIIPVPLHPSRKRKRGFNQSEIIGRILSQRFDLPLNNRVLQRISNTEAQIKMGNDEERRENVTGSMAISEEGKEILARYQAIILVDDVYTSGATMREAVKILRRAGVKNIIGFVVAKTG